MRQHERVADVLSLRYRVYYALKPFIPRALQLLVRRRIVQRLRRKHWRAWPIDARAAGFPEGWTGWPERKRFAVVLTHDVESEKGLSRCRQVMDLESHFGFRSSFHFVVEDYRVPEAVRRDIEERGFEVALHGLRHDCSLYRSRKEFITQASRINRYLEEWGCVGFRSPAMHRNLEWLHRLRVEYDASTFDTDPFEPMPGGVCTIFPFTVNSSSRSHQYIELPYTMPQDFTLFILMGEGTIDLWKQKLSWLAAHGGMALCLTHPDYMSFGEDPVSREEYPASLYEQLLTVLKTEYEGQYWHALPREVARFWSQRKAPVD